MIKEKLKILHISANVGGGVGSVLYSYLKHTKSNESLSHEVICLDYANEHFSKDVRELDLSLIDNVFKNNLMDEVYLKIAQADIVLCHWWDHPLIYNFLLDQNIPPCRLIIWSHVSGLFAPYVYSEQLIDMSDYFVFTTPLSYDTKEIKNLSEDKKSKITTIWSVSDNTQFEDIIPIPHDGNNVLLTGTVDYGKLDSRYLEICQSVKAENTNFIVCSGDSQEEIKKEAENIKFANKFSFLGRVPDLKDYLSVADVFSYFLQPLHFGSSEQSLTEAMLSQVTPVVFNNPTESYIVEDGVSGIVVKNKEGAVQGIEFLLQNPIKRKEMGMCAKLRAKELASVEKNAHLWDRVFEKVIVMQKTKKRWGIESNLINGHYLFVESLGEYGVDFNKYIYCKLMNDKVNLNDAILGIKKLFQSNPMFYSKSKGSVHQYLQFFPNDSYLKEWAKIL